MKQANYDFLEKCTKEELIYNIRKVGWLRQMFCYSDILFSRWDKKSRELSERRKKNSDFLSSLDAKKQDELAQQFNKETDINKRLEIVNKMKPYQTQFNKWKKEYEKIRKEEDKLDILYKSIDTQRQKE